MSVLAGPHAFAACAVKVSDLRVSDPSSCQSKSRTQRLRAPAALRTAASQRTYGTCCRASTWTAPYSSWAWAMGATTTQPGAFSTAPTVRGLPHRTARLRLLCCGFLVDRRWVQLLDGIEARHFHRRLPQADTSAKLAHCGCSCSRGLPPACLIRPRTVRTPVCCGAAHVRRSFRASRPGQLAASG